MTQVAFRFDIDSHKCIRDGVPILLEIAEQYKIGFTFYLNAGKAISIKDTIKGLFIGSEEKEDIKMLSARTKLGNIDYCYAAIVNPEMINYKKNILDIYHSRCELGLHGGLNHASWYSHALEWDENKIEYEISKAIQKIRTIIPEYYPEGFAAPGFVTNEIIEETLRKMEFKYSSNVYSLGRNKIIEDYKGMKQACVNLCGEPGGVAFWEYAEAMGWSDSLIVEKFMEQVSRQSKVLVFDHPYYVAVKKANLLKEIIGILLEQGNEIVTVQELIFGKDERINER